MALKTTLLGRCYFSGQNHQKNSLKECVFVILALKIQCHVVSKIHSYRLLFPRFCPLSKTSKW